MGLRGIAFIAWRRSVMQLGLEPEDQTGNRVNAILNTRSDINACHGHLGDRAEDLRRRCQLLLTVWLPATSPCSREVIVSTLALSRKMFKVTTFFNRYGVCFLARKGGFQRLSVRSAAWTPAAASTFPPCRPR